MTLNGAGRVLVYEETVSFDIELISPDIVMASLVVLLILASLAYALIRHRRTR